MNEHATFPRRHASLLSALVALTAVHLGAGCAVTTHSADPDSSTQGAIYTTERVTYESQGVLLSGILWLPTTPGPHPALVIVDGSGKTKADLMRNVIEHYVEMGIACLSYDKRGVGASGGKYLGRLSIDIPLLAKDVVAGVNFLGTRAEIDGSRVGLWGQSQAGWVIPVAASESPHVSVTVILSGPAVTLGEESLFSKLAGTDPFWKYIYRDLSFEEISRRLAEEGPSLFDPLPYLEQMNVPGLWLYGGLDRSQPTRESVVILDDLIRNHQKEFTYRVFEGADHGLRIDDKISVGWADVVDSFLARHLQLVP